MAVIHGFQLVTERDIPELQTRAEHFRHSKTGAELLSLRNKDENKVFGITFRTPPVDATGVAHILEHSVLCGSRKYPVKEPFVELLKGSLQTFLNAFTYPDRTCYPVASQNLQDFYNLIDVYLDAVFYPRLTPFTLQQEGWRYELEDPDGPLTYKGVVFNEMKGAYSSPDRLLAEYSQQSLFPNHPYGLDSGGDPREIPKLSFDQFKSLHQMYYHPSNARIYFYGDDDPEERLRLANNYLRDFEPLIIDSTIPIQPSFDRPRRLALPFAVGKEQGTKAKGMLTVNWLFTATTDLEVNLALRMLNHLLLGMPASPLRKALIDSGLGEDLAGVGLEDELRQTYFSTGLKGIDIQDADRIEALIRETLTGLVRNGIDPLTVEAAANTIEFRLRENNSGNYPRGLLLMLRSLSTWLYDGDPMEILAFEAPLETVKSRLKADPSLFEGLIDRFFLSNPHRTTLVLQPDPGLQERRENAERERLAGALAAMRAEEVQAVMENSRHLKLRQQTPDPPEALATIPTLRLSDLDRQNKIIPLRVVERLGTKILYHDLPTSGIVYLDLGFNLHTLPQEYLPYVHLFGRGLLEMGTDEEDFVTLTQRISRKTGGITPKTFASTVKGNESGAVWLFLRGKAMQAQTHELFTILKDVLLGVRLDNRERFRQMVLEEKARQEERLVPEGHLIVNLRLRAHFNEADWAAEQMKGVSYLEFLRQLTRQVDENWHSVLAVLEEIRRLLVNRQAMLVNLTLDEAGWAQVEPHLTEFLVALPSSSVSEALWLPQSTPGYEGMTIPVQVNYVGKGGNLYQFGYRLHGSASVISRYLRTAWLWDRIRVQGGAYGAFCLFNKLSGVLTFVSYRDPNFHKTLETFDQTAQFLRTVELSGEELAKSIIGAIGDMDAYLLSDAKGFVSMARYLAGETDEDLQRLRDEILGTTMNDFRSFADSLEGVREQGLVKVLGPSRVIEGAAAEVAGGLHVVRVL
jgi:Zn-dependent M16 (insulinase) family peptidase